MKIETYGFEQIRPKWVKWYTRGFTGIKILGAKFLGVSIYYNHVVVDIKTLRSNPSVGVWLYVFFYIIHIELKDPWKNERMDK